MKSSRIISFGLVIMALLSFLTGLYPLVFIFIPESRGIFSDKPAYLINSAWYIPTFIVHVSFGALAILSGCTQFFESIRKKYLKAHKLLGKIYVLSVIPSGLTGLLVGFYATGTWYSKAGFIGLALGWLITTIMGYLTIRKREITKHQKWMMRSFAFCFAFVTFRIYLGLGAALKIPFFDYYSYLSFLSWVPNVLFVEWRIRQLKL